MQFPAIKLGVLAFFMFGIWSLFNDHSFIVLFPFIKDFTFVIVLMSIIQARLNIRSLWALIFFSSLGLLSSQFIWELIMSNEQLNRFAESGWFDILKLSFHISAIIWLTTLSIKFNHHRNSIMLGIFAYFLLFIMGNFIVPNVNLILECITWIVLGSLAFFVIRNKNLGNEGNFQFQLLVGIGVMHLLSLVSLQQ